MNLVTRIFLIIFFVFKTVDCTILFSNDSARILMNSGSEIRFNPATVNGWNDRSLIKNLTGVGLGDYDLTNYSANPIILYSQAPGELVYDNSNAIVGLSVTTRTNSNAFAYGIKNSSNALLYLNRTNSNALLFGGRSNSNTPAVPAKNFSH